MQYNITYREKDKGIQFIISYKDNAGKWKQKSKQGFKTKGAAKTAADKMLDALKEDIKKNINTDYENITFKEFKDIYMDHLALYKQHNTIIIYNQALKHFESLYDIKLNKINTMEIQMCVDEMVKSKLKYSTINTYVIRLNAIFNAAIKQYKAISSSPLDNVELKIDKEESNKKAITKEQFDMLISKTKNFKYKVIFLLAGTCGLRLGEILGLTWDCVDFKRAELTINKQWKNIAKGKTGFGELKSKNSYRTVPIPVKTVLPVLQEFKKNYPTDIHNRVITYKYIQGLSHLFKSHFKKCNLDISIHELRHTYATLLISNGTDFKTAAKLLGHDVEQTMRTYSHVTDDMKAKATDTINKIFLNF
ncbi:site-specific integrase [Clostridium pasteurianum]|uniref:site-specific integrase n=1 Tax=Clostridium pasteurianum TaxID=1501 RepID=UPI002260EACE|nr:site-specific integrase [Clostridium pasteurianum]UZW13238.1 site-specific integrase [Clostridium pasteurianum]